MHISRQTLILLMVILIPAGVSAVTTVIPPGGDVFLGEEGLDIRGSVPPPYDAIAFYPPGSAPGRDMPLDTRTVNPLSFSVSPALFTDRTGPWYQWDSRRGVAGTIACTIREPRVHVRILKQSTMEDVSSGTVPRGTALVFQLDTNTGTIAQRPGYNAASDGILDLLLTTPGGGIVTSVETRWGGSAALTRITPGSSLATYPSPATGGWDTGAATSSTGSFYSGGEYQVKPRLIVNRMDENLQDDGGSYSVGSASVTLGSDRITVTTRDDQVIRGNSFPVTVSGSQGVPVYLWVDAGTKSGLPGDQPPMILFAQEGVSQDSPEGPYIIGSYRPRSANGQNIRELVPREPYGGVKYYAMVMPDRSGQRTVEFRTSEQTDDTKYTIRIESPSGSGQVQSDESAVTVVKGSVSLSSGKQIYAIGEEVRLSGMNSESCDTYLFITGPNLPSAGGRLDRPREAVRTGVPSSFTIASGDCETWEFRLYTGELGIDAGTYLIYAVPSPVDRSHLGSVPYQTIPLTLRSPSVTIHHQETSVARGDSLTLTGRSTGVSGPGVAVWIFGKNFFVYDHAQVEQQGTFEYELSAAQTAGMAQGQYVVIIQHPMGNGEFDIRPDNQRQLVVGNYPYPGAPIFRVGGPGALVGSDAAQALITALNSQFIDDVYTRYDIRVTSPKISINQSSLRQEAGEPVIIEGTTNLGAGKRLLIEITDNQFSPTRKTDQSGSYGYSGTTEIREGIGSQTFSLVVPAGRLVPGEYRLFVQAVESDAVTSELLTIISPAPRMQSTPVVSVNTTLVHQENVTPSNLSPPVQSLNQSTLRPLQTEKPPIHQGDDQTFSILTGVGIGLLIAGLIVLIGYLIKRREISDEDEEEEREPEGEEEVT